MGKPGHCRQHPDLERRGVEDEDGRERNRQRADLVSEDGDRLRRPEPQEEGLAMQGLEPRSGSLRPSYPPVAVFENQLAVGVDASAVA